jgi:tyrosyl-tRNA synthetase
MHHMPGFASASEFAKGAFYVCALQVKRLIKGGGVYLNNAKVTQQDAVVQAQDLIDGRLLLLAAGKKNKMLVRING